ncbi:MAG: hypothetical protein Tsb0021_05170 [Chlamydiales bacterium]
MTRISKQNERRSQSPRRPRSPSVKTGPVKDNLPKGYKEHQNALDNELGKEAFIPKIKSVK